MLIVLAIVVGIAYGARRSFTPKVLDVRDHHKERVWMLLNPKCFETEDDVHTFKDYLLDQYQCIDYNDERPKIYKHAGKSWSLWIEKNIYQPDYKFECLNENVTMPNKLASECVEGVYWEPLEHIMDDAEQSCQVQPTSATLYSLDFMDGVFNSEYEYFEYGDSNVEAIVLDTGVTEEHVEFADLTVTNLFTGTPSPQMQYDHGTHCSGTVVGHDVGGAKRTNLNWYPVCQLGGSCAWNTIEGGYEAAIALMTANPTKTYVINYSVGGSRTSSNEAAYNNWGIRIQNAGSFWATSAGNSGSDACNFAPAFTQYAITVAAYDNSRSYAWFTNYGSCVDTWGPGVNVYSSLGGGGYGLMSGTSMSSPNIASLIVNLAKDDPDLTLPQIRTYLLANNFPVSVPSNFGQATGAYFAKCTFGN